MLLAPAQPGCLPDQPPAPGHLATVLYPHLTSFCSLHPLRSLSMGGGGPLPTLPPEAVAWILLSLCFCLSHTGSCAPIQCSLPPFHGFIFTVLTRSGVSWSVIHASCLILRQALLSVRVMTFDDSLSVQDRKMVATEYSEFRERVKVR